MIDLTVFLKKNDYKPEQVQDFIPAPFDIAACMYHTGLDPMTMKPVTVARKMRERKALLEAGRKDLIGSGCDTLIPLTPPREALDARMASARRQLEEDHVHSKARRPGVGYRPGRKGRSGDDGSSARSSV